MMATTWTMVMTLLSHPSTSSKVLHYRISGFTPSLNTRTNTDEGAVHLLELSKLAEKDPEFYKYLQENDRELLDFNMDGDDDNDNDDDDGHSADDAAGPEGDRLPSLTEKILRSWQKSLLEVGIASSRQVFDTSRFIDLVPTGVAQASHRIPLCCAHE